jgi:hypothetical protein
MRSHGRLNQAHMRIMRAYNKDQWESRWHGVHAPVEFAKIDAILHVCEYNKTIEKTSLCGRFYRCLSVIVVHAHALFIFFFSALSLRSVESGSAPTVFLFFIL